MKALTVQADTKTKLDLDEGPQIFCCLGLPSWPCRPELVTELLKSEEKALKKASLQSFRAFQAFEPFRA